MRAEFLPDWMRGLPWLALLVLGAIGLFAAGGDMLLPYDPNELDLGASFKPPPWQDGGSSAYLLGTDNLGRDILSRIMAGSRVSVIVAFYAILFSGSIGALVGMIAGYFGGRVDAVLMRFTDGIITLPLLPLLIVLGAIDLTKLGFSQDFARSGAAGFWRIVVIISIVDWTAIARISRAATLALKERDFVRAARASGAGAGYTMLTHILPNVATPVIVAFTLTIGRVILAESVLSFLGFGVVPPTPSWGNMLNNAQELVTTAPALAVYPGLLIFLTVVAVNFLGDGLQHAFDPRSEK